VRFLPEGLGNDVGKHRDITFNGPVPNRSDKLRIAIDLDEDSSDGYNACTR